MVTKTGGGEIRSVIALPWAALEGSTLVRDWPHHPADPQALVAVPAIRRADGHGWQADLWFDERPVHTAPLESHDWRTYVLQDAPYGLEEVHLRIHYRRWRTPGTRGSVKSSVPSALTGSQRKGLKITPALTQFVLDVQTRLDIPAALVCRSLRADPEAGQSLRSKIKPISPPAADCPQPQQFILRRPTTVPQRLALDEIYLGSTYWTVISDDTKRPLDTLGQGVIGLCRGRYTGDLLPALKVVASWYREEQPTRPRPERIVCDMWSAFWDASIHEEVFGDDVRFAVDPFHVRRQMRAAQEKAGQLCPTKCGKDARCPQCQYTDQVDALLARLLNSRSFKQWREFRAEWTDLRQRPKENGNHTWLQAHAKFDGMLRPWGRASRLRMLAQTASSPVQYNNARAEALNRRVRKVMRHLRFKTAEARLEAIMQQLHADPVVPESQSVAVPPSILTCPSCQQAATQSGRASWNRVHLLPRGLTPLTADVPECAQCNRRRIQMSGGAPTVDHALVAWLSAPMQGELPRSTLRQLSGMESGTFRAHQTLPAVPKRRDRPETVVYHEFWMNRRVWLALATPDGDLLDLRLAALSKVTGTRYIEGRHEQVARQAAIFLKRHEPPQGYRQVMLWKEYRQLSLALGEEAWTGDAPPFILSAYSAHNLPRRAIRAALKETSPHDAEVLRNYFSWWQTGTAEVGVPAELTLRQHPAVRETLWDALELKSIFKGEGDDRSLPLLFFGRSDRTETTPHPALNMRRRQWAAWVALEDPIWRTANSEKMSVGHHPHLRRLIRGILSDALSQTPHELRARALAVAHARYTERVSRHGGQPKQSP